jgi:hypothetical protein
MIFRTTWFNLYFAAAVVLVAGIGCQTSKKQKESSLLRVHLEAGPEVPTNRCTVVQLPRNHPIDVQIDRTAFLSETDVKEAKVVEDLGGFSIRLQFNRKGSWILEQNSASNRGKHFVVYAQFVTPGQQEHTEGRWLAAPRITRNLADGVLLFAPDASREEAEEIVLGLNNIARQLEQDSVWNN